METSEVRHQPVETAESSPSQGGWQREVFPVLAIYLLHPIATTIGDSWMMDKAPINVGDWVKITQST
jgi:hypothetical protein